MSELATPVVLPPLAETLRERTARARQSLKTEHKKLARLLEKLAIDAARAHEAPMLRASAEVLKTQLQAVPRGATTLTLPVPWDPPSTVTMALRPDLSAQANMQRMFQRARGLEQGGAVIARRQDEVQLRQWEVAERVAAWEALLQRALAWQVVRDRGETPPERARTILSDADPWLASVRALGLTIDDSGDVSELERRIFNKNKDKNKGGTFSGARGVEVFATAAGAPVLAGRNAAGNDALVTRLMRGRDWWLHVRDQAGAHVVLRWDRPEPPPESELIACAVLAAHLSGLAKGTRAEVTVCQAKHVRKVKGAPAGAVYVHGERAIRVEVDAATIDAFYQRRRTA